MAAKTVFVMLYVGATEQGDEWVRPDQITRMTDEQAERTDIDSRLDWTRFSMSSAPVIPGRWYAVNTREPIRDETIRQGLESLGAVVTRPLPTTSSAGRYALKQSFADLFDPDLRGTRLDGAIRSWREENLSPGALARVRLVRDAVVNTDRGMIATFANGETRRLAEGPSSVIAKAVVEEFAARFLERPAVLWLSESATKEEARDVELARQLGITIEADRNLPDLILVDIGPEEPLFVFVEVVATDGAITEARREALLPIIVDAGYDAAHIAFVTAYLDRDHASFKKTFSALGWRTFAWCVSEPDNIVVMASPRTGMTLAGLLQELG